ncbi:MAG: hypothetical protein ACFCVK_01600 [Acidimicrobiales bacterium]
MSRSGAELIDGYADALIAAVAEAIGPWVERSIDERHPGPVPEEMAVRARRAGAEATEQVVERLRHLLALDIDEQWTNPLSIIRDAVTFPTAVLAEAGVAPAPRDETAARLHPDDLYDLAPASFADLDPAVQEPGIAWGAAKAHIHLQRRREERK